MDKKYFQLQGIQFVILEDPELINDYNHFIEECEKTFGRHSKEAAFLISKHKLWEKWGGHLAYLVLRDYFKNDDESGDEPGPNFKPLEEEK